MDFSSLISKEISNKRNQSRKRFKLSRSKPSNVNSQLSTQQEVDSTAHTQPQPSTNTEAPEPEVPDSSNSKTPKSESGVPGEDNEPIKVATTDSDTGPLSKQMEQSADDQDNTLSKLDSQLASFDIPSANLSQQEKVDKLREIIKQEKYKRYLQLELDLLQSPLIEDDINLQNCHDLSIKVRIYLKNLIKQWEVSQNQLDLLHQVKIDVVKLLYKLRKQKLDNDMVISLATIIHYIQMREFNQANQAYLELSIGNVAWPIGIQNIGIHARSAQQKLVSKSANIMINDETRRWIVSIKRLITWVENETS